MESEQFILYSANVPIAGMIFQYESDAQRMAEGIARNNRGAKVYIAKLIACVTEPLPALQWSDDRTAGQGGGNSDLTTETPYGLGECNRVAALPSPMSEKACRSTR